MMRRDHEERLPGSRSIVLSLMVRQQLSVGDQQFVDKDIGLNSFWAMEGCSVNARLSSARACRDFHTFPNHLKDCWSSTFISVEIVYSEGGPYLRVET
jgi:hypothetical protein